MNDNTICNRECDASLLGKQQLLIKGMLSQQNALIAKQQLAVKSGLAQKRTLSLR